MQGVYTYLFTYHYCSPAATGSWRPQSPWGTHLQEAWGQKWSGVFIAKQPSVLFLVLSTFPCWFWTLVVILFCCEGPHPIHGRSCHLCQRRPGQSHLRADFHLAGQHDQWVHGEQGEVRSGRQESEQGGWAFTDVLLSSGSLKEDCDRAFGHIWIWGFLRKQVGRYIFRFYMVTMLWWWDLNEIIICNSLMDLVELDLLIEMISSVLSSSV